MLSEMSKKDKYCMISLVCGIFKNLKKKKTPISSENGLVVTRGKAKGVGRMGKEGQKVKMSSFKIRPGDGDTVTQHGDYN